VLIVHWALVRSVVAFLRATARLSHHGELFCDWNFQEPVDFLSPRNDVQIFIFVSCFVSSGEFHLKPVLVLREMRLFMFM
jgi:hypothetical protein